MLTAVFLQTHLLGSADAVQMLHRTILCTGSPSHQSQYIPPRSKTTKAVYWIRKEQARDFFSRLKEVGGDGVVGTMLLYFT